MSSFPEPDSSRPEVNIRTEPPLPESRPPILGPWRLLLVIVIPALMLFMFMRPTTVRAAWDQIEQLLKLEGKPEPASANVLSEHEMEALDKMPAQSQAQLLLERSINHYKGANEQIEQRVAHWRGDIELNQKLNGLFTTALNSDDLRVRATAIEIDLAARNMEKTSAQLDLLEPDARHGAQGPRVNALWNIALLANRGVEPERALEILLDSIHDDNHNVRFWAVESLSYLGTDASINPLLDVFRNDPSPAIRERAACGLAQSGMLREKQRRSAVPKLLDYAEDPSLDEQTHNWVYQALRDITGQSLPHDAAAWRNWYNSSAEGNWNPVTRDAQ